MAPTYRLTIPLTPDLTLVSINALTKNGPWYRAKHAKAWRAAGRAAAIKAGLPAGLDYVTIDVWIYKARGGRYDPGNVAVTLKWIIDGFVDAGLIADDDHNHLDGPHAHHGGTDKTNPRLGFLIRETSPSNEHDTGQEDLPHAA